MHSHEAALSTRNRRPGETPTLSVGYRSHLSKLARRTSGAAKLAFIASPFSRISVRSAWIPGYEGVGKGAALNRVSQHEAVNTPLFLPQETVSVATNPAVSSAGNADFSLTVAIRLSLRPALATTLPASATCFVAPASGATGRATNGREPRHIILRAGFFTSRVSLLRILSHASFEICQINGGREGGGGWTETHRVYKRQEQCPTAMVGIKAC